MCILQLLYSTSIYTSVVQYPTSNFILDRWLRGYTAQRHRSVFVQPLHRHCHGHILPSWAVAQGVPPESVCCHGSHVAGAMSATLDPVRARIDNASHVSSHRGEVFATVVAACHESRSRPLGARRPHSGSTVQSSRCRLRSTSIRSSIHSYGSPHFCPPFRFPLLFFASFTPPHRPYSPPPSPTRQSNPSDSRVASAPPASAHPRTLTSVTVTLNHAEYKLRLNPYLSSFSIPSLSIKPPPKPPPKPPQPPRLILLHIQQFLTARVPQDVVFRVARGLVDGLRRRGAVGEGRAVGERDELREGVGALGAA